MCFFFRISRLLFLQSNPNMYEVLKIFLEYTEGGKGIPLYQRISDLEETDRNLWSVPVLDALF